MRLRTAACLFGERLTFGSADWILRNLLHHRGAGADVMIMLYSNSFLSDMESSLSPVAPSRSKTADFAARFDFFSHGFERPDIV